MKKGTKAKQIAVRFDYQAYEKISKYAAIEHRGIGEFVRHATLFYLEQCEKEKESLGEKHPFGCSGESLRGV